MEQRAEDSMTADGFGAWRAEQPDRFELIGGLTVRMMNERTEHASAKAEIARQLFAQIPRGAPCRVLLDGLAVRVDDANVFEPDLMVQCGALIAGAMMIDDPFVVFEILSSSTTSFDMLHKVPAYLRMTSLAHVVVLDPAKRRAMLFSKGQQETILGGEEAIHLALPGGAVEIALAQVFEGLTP
ncbi:MAG: Uma2 family endonuclease [Pseudomonadota bacterium]